MIALVRPDAKGNFFRLRLIQDRAGRLAAANRGLPETALDFIFFWGGARLMALKPDGPALKQANYWMTHLRGLSASV